MKKIAYKPSGICSTLINIEINDDNVITFVEYIGGCPGNLIGIKQLVEGQKCEDVISKLKDVTCGTKSSSCPAQLAKALMENM